MLFDGVLFDSWSGVLRVLVVGTLAYLALVAWLRVTEKRTVSKWNAFDLIVTIALGSTLATVLLSKQVALVEGLAYCGRGQKKPGRSPAPAPDQA